TRSVVSVLPRSGGCSSTGGACSSTTCALVPLKPNDDTAARRGAVVAGHGVNSVGTKNRVDDASIAGLQPLKWRLAGIWLCRNAIVAFIRPATPPAASR